MCLLKNKYIYTQTTTHCLAKGIKRKLNQVSGSSGQFARSTEDKVALCITQEHAIYNIQIVGNSTGDMA